MGLLHKCLNSLTLVLFTTISLMQYVLIKSFNKTNTLHLNDLILSTLEKMANSRRRDK